MNELRRRRTKNDDDDDNERRRDEKRNLRAVLSQYVQHLSVCVCVSNTHARPSSRGKINIGRSIQPLLLLGDSARGGRSAEQQQQRPSIYCPRTFLQPTDRRSCAILCTTFFSISTSFALPFFTPFFSVYFHHSASCPSGSFRVCTRTKRIKGKERDWLTKFQNPRHFLFNASATLYQLFVLHL